MAASHNQFAYKRRYSPWERLFLCQRWHFNGSGILALRNQQPGQIPKLEGRQHVPLTLQFDHLLGYEAPRTGCDRTLTDRPSSAEAEGTSAERRSYGANRAPKVGEAGVSSLGQSTPARVVGAAGPAESEHGGWTTAVEQERVLSNAHAHIPVRQSRDLQL